jgi:predicted  nucleic acid-binding Zn-ribbon protein
VPWNQFFALQEIDAQIDQLREELSLASLLSDETNAHLKDEIARARREEAKTREQLAIREQQRREAAAFIPTVWLKHYDRLRQRVKTRPWVVRLAGTSCPACNITLPSKLAAEARRNHEPIACPSCQRLLLRQRPEEKTQ